MRNKNLITNKLERIESKLKVLNFHIGTNNRDEAYTSLDDIVSRIEEIKTLLNTETQD